MVVLQQFHDLKAVGERARREKRVIVLVVSQKGCAYCHRLKEEVLLPMIRGGDFADEILLGEVFMDEGEWLVDFQGRKVEGQEFARRYGISVTPTVLFLSPEGKELAERMVGITVLDMYFYYLSQAIEEAVRKLRGGAS